MTKTLWLAFLFGVFGVAACGHSLPPYDVTEGTVARAHTTIEDLKLIKASPGGRFRSNLANAKAALLFPDVMRNRFSDGAEMGAGVLLIRLDSKTWSYPAFYKIVQDRSGFTFGAPSARLVFLFYSDDAVRSAIDGQFQLPAGTDWTAAQSVANSTLVTWQNQHPDVTGYGLVDARFVGSTPPTAPAAASEILNRAYYGRPVTPQEILMQDRVFNLQADPLRMALVVQ